VIGGIAGDIIGSAYEGRRAKDESFPLFVPGCRFTDDTVMTLAVAQALLDGGPYRDWLLELGRRHPDAGYGGSFRRWLASADPQPYRSYGNGSAMRVGAVPWFFRAEADVLREARRSAMPTHDHPEGIKGAEATALCIRMALDGRGKDEIARRISETFGYTTTTTYAELRRHEGFDVTCQGTVPPAIVTFLASRSYEDAVRKAVALGGDSDTLACITGSIAEAFYGEVPEPIVREVAKRLTVDLLAILRDATARHGAEPARGLLLPMIAVRESLVKAPGIEIVPPRHHRDCLVARVAGAGSAWVEGACSVIPAAAVLNYGMLIVDFSGKDPRAAAGRIASLLRGAAASSTVVVVKPAPSLAAALGSRLPATMRIMRELAHALAYGDLLAEQAIRRTWS